MMMFLWTVKNGTRRRWFPSEKQAREFARDRLNAEEDGVPFIEEFPIPHLNTLTAVLNSFENYWEVRDVH